MPRRRDTQGGGSLFGDGPIDRALEVVPTAPSETRLTAAAAALPADVRFGTSSWAFPGWRGILYGERAPASELARHGLAAYASQPLLRTVGLDRAYYSLLSPSDAAGLASLVPVDFRFLVKAHQSVTRPDMDASGGTFGDTASLGRRGVPNPRFLDPSFASQAVVMPAVEGFGQTLGPIVFQFPPLRFGSDSAVGTAEQWIDRLDRFLSALPHGPTFAVEVRNRELSRGELGARLLRTLRDHRVAWGFAVHPTMPPLSEQAAFTSRFNWPISEQPALSLRWLLGHGLGYDEAKRRYDPFSRIVDDDPVTRREVIHLLLEAVRARVPAWVVVNNKAEGSAPLTVGALAEAFGAALHPAGGSPRSLGL